MIDTIKEKTIVKIQTSDENAKRWAVSASRLGMSRNDYLLTLLGNSLIPLPLTSVIRKNDPCPMDHR